MKTIKLYDGVTVTIDGESQTVEGPADLWPLLNLTEEYFPDTALLNEMKHGITTQLICFGRADLSDAYAGHTVLLSLVPAKEGADGDDEA